MIAEYLAHDVDLSPTCNDFGFYGERFVKPEDSHGSWGILKEGIIYNNLALIQEYSGLLGDARVTSAYRCPHKNAGTPGAARQSRHMFGDALDLYPPEGYAVDLHQYTRMRNAASQTSPGWMSNWDTYADRHLHVDWRNK